MILNDIEICEIAVVHGAITPFERKSVRQLDGVKCLSFGVSSFGYDVRLSDKSAKIFTNKNGVVIDPKDFDDGALDEAKLFTDERGRGQYFLIPPNSYMLGHTVERFKIPEDILVLCVGKSTYARCGSIVNVTPIEPDFEGNVVLEITNSTSLPMRVYANEGVAQFIFMRGNRPETTYADRNGKYQGQTGLALPRM